MSRAQHEGGESTHECKIVGGVGVIRQDALLEREPADLGIVGQRDANDALRLNAQDLGRRVEGRARVRGATWGGVSMPKTGTPRSLRPNPPVRNATQLTGMGLCLVPSSTYCLASRLNRSMPYACKQPRAGGAQPNARGRGGG